MPFEIEYQLGGTDNHVYRVNRRFATCDEAGASATKFMALLRDHEKLGMRVTILWVDDD